MTKIMLVEDDNNLREIYEARLSAEGFEVVAAQDGEAALAIAGKEKPDMIISDVMMPKISGFEMLDILRNTDSLKHVKIIMLTALGQAEDSQRANSLGADRYLVKSQVTLEDIVKAAHELLDDGAGAAPAAAIGAATTDATDTSDAPAPTADAAASDAPTGATATAAATPADDTPAAPAASASTAPVSIADAIVPPPAEPAAPAADNPLEPAPGTSIPVTDAPNDDAPAAIADTPAVPASTPTRIEVVEPPETNPETGTAPAASPEPLAAEPPTVADSEEKVDSSAPQATGDEEAAMHAQIADFINNQPAVPAETTTEVTDQNDSPVPLDVTTAEPEPSAEEPASLGSQPETTTSPEAPLVPETSPADEPAASSTGPAPISGISQPEATREADFEPAAESLDVHSAPTITPVPGADETAPAASRAATPKTDPATASGDQLLDSAIADMSESTANQPAVPDTAELQADSGATNSKKVISPLSAGEPTDLNQLLAVEEAKTAATQASAATQAPQPNIGAYNPSTGVNQPQQQTPDQPDPNSISL